MRLLLLAAGLTTLLLVAATVGVSRWWHAPLALPNNGMRLVVDRGESLGAISRRLSADGLLQHPGLLNAVARFTGADQQIRSGEFFLSSDTSPQQLLRLLQSSDTVRYHVTLPEGITLAMAIDRLSSAPGLELELSGPEDARLLALAEPHAVAEGLFLPETYQYQRGDSDFSVLEQAHRMMRETLDALWKARSPAVPYAQPYDALIMASLVERETGVVEERARIAGVFVRRLLRGMRLQTDPAVIYGLGAGFDGNLTRAHLRDDSNPYNTYRHDGLPPSPIALPGRAALAAALDPAEDEALYFVARGDGTHAFSRTLEEHQRAVRRYQLQRRHDYRSAPAVRQAEPGYRK